ncbi:MAG: hypothetical protein VCA36_10560 [Opitutales bacterium]
MKKALLLLIPLLAFGGTPVPKQGPELVPDKEIIQPVYPKYLQDYTFKERIKIDKLSTQLRLHYRALMLTKSCSAKNRRARAYYKAKYEELRQLEPTMTKYVQLNRYAR